jgi:hypothetical protein
MALPFEFLLRFPETRHACRNLGSLAREPFFLFRHRPSRSCLIRFDSRPDMIGGREWGVNWETALQDCDRLHLLGKGGG